MKPLYLIPLLFLSACSTAPRLALRPQPPSSLATDTVRYPEIVRAYHFGRYVDPNDDLVMHEQHVVYRVEENTRWKLQPLRAATIGYSVVPSAPTSLPQDAAFISLPVNDAMRAEVNAQKLATVQMLSEAKTLMVALAQFQSALAQTKTNLQETAILRASITQMRQRLDALETAPPPISTFSTTNAAPDPLVP